MSKKDYMHIVNANCFDSYKENFPNVLFVRCFVRDNFISAKSNHLSFTLLWPVQLETVAGIKAWEKPRNHCTFCKTSLTVLLFLGHLQAKC